MVVSLLNIFIIFILGRKHEARKYVWIVILASVMAAEIRKFKIIFNRLWFAGYNTGDGIFIFCRYIDYDRETV